MIGKGREDVKYICKILKDLPGIEKGTVLKASTNIENGKKKLYIQQPEIARTHGDGLYYANEGTILYKAFFEHGFMDKKPDAERLTDFKCEKCGSTIFDISTECWSHYDRHDGVRRNHVEVTKECICGNISVLVKK